MKAGALLLKVGVWPVGLDEGATLLGYSARQRELDLAVVHLGDQGTSALASRHNLAPNDLEKVENVILTIGAAWNLKKIEYERSPGWRGPWPCVLRPCRGSTG